jgi:hypothetical protein
MRLVRSAILAGLLATAGPTLAQEPGGSVDPTPAVLARLQPGLWNVRMLEGSTEPARDICLGDPRILVQLRHGGASCSLFVAADAPRMATISYTCPGTGSGRTSLRLGASGLLRIDSQGIADQAPFAFVAEARRTGACPAAPAAAKAGTPAPAR